MSKMKKVTPRLLVTKDTELDVMFIDGYGKEVKVDNVKVIRTGIGQYTVSADTRTAKPGKYRANYTPENWEKIREEKIRQHLADFKKAEEFTYFKFTGKKKLK